MSAAERRTLLLVEDSEPVRDAYSILLADVSHDREHVVVGCDLSQPTARFLQWVWRASTDDHTTSFCNQGPGAGKAQPFARSCDNRHAVFQSEVHGRG